MLYFLINSLALVVYIYNLCSDNKTIILHKAQKKLSVMFYHYTQFISHFTFCWAEKVLQNCEGFKIKEDEKLRTCQVFLVLT